MLSILFIHPDIFRTPAASLHPPPPPSESSLESPLSVRLQSLTPDVYDMDSSSGEMVILRRNMNMEEANPVQYELCTYKHVCAGSNALYFYFTNYTEYQAYEKLLSSCFTPDKPRYPQGVYSPCHCFYPQFLPKLLPWYNVHNNPSWPASVVPFNPMDKMNRGHYTSIHKYVNRHHIAHWAQKLVLYSSVMQHQLSFPHLGPIQGMIFHDTELPLTNHEAAILNMTIMSLLAVNKEHIGLQHYLDDIHDSHLNTHRSSNIIHWHELDERLRDQQPACYEQISFTRAFGIFSTNSIDTSRFREAAYKLFNIHTLSSSCPPPNIVLLYRENRGIINQQEIMDMITREFHKEVQLKTINGKSTSQEQVELFASAGLLLSAHSSQMVNVLFSHPNSAMIEISSEFYNADFAEYAHGMGVYFQYALGGEVPGADPHNGQKECVAVLNECDGDSHCILKQRHFCGQRSGNNKNSNFVADIDRIRRAVQHAIDHLDWACNGKW